MPASDIVLAAREEWVVVPEVDGPDEIIAKAATEKAFTTYDIQACLYDAHRVKYLRGAIQQTVRPGDVVVDAGSGTGLLGLFAAQAGAAKVYCLELNPDFKEVIEENARRNGLADKIEVCTVDATRCLLPEKVDVIVSEVISAGFFYEPQLQIVNNLRRFLKPGGRVVPRSMINYVELINAQEYLYGLKFSFDSRFTELEEDRSLTDNAIYLSSNFAESTGVEPTVRAQVTVRATESGRANAVKITYDVEFYENVWATTPTEILGAGEDPGSWPALLNPQIIFLPETVDLIAGDKYEVTLAYEASSAPTTCEINIAPAL
jgi:precorrin-6B methylase 2